MTQLQNTILSIISKVPFGKVANYGQVAAIAGVPRAARQVGWILNRNEGKSDLPWWRIVNNQGRITIKGNEFNSALLQKQLLQNEGIQVNNDYTLDIEKYRFRLSAQFLHTLQLDTHYIQQLIQKYGI